MEMPWQDSVDLLAAKGTGVFAGDLEGSCKFSSTATAIVFEPYAGSREVTKLESRRCLTKSASCRTDLIKASVCSDLGKRF